MPPAPPSETAPALTVIRPRGRWNALLLGEIWRYRDLLWILSIRDVKVRYKQTIVGGLWAVMQPLLTVLVFSTLFRLLGRAPASGDVPYPVTLYCALLPWQLFASALTQSSESIIANQNLVTKVYFPRVLIPLSAVLTGLVDFAIALAVLFVLMAFYGVTPTAAILTLPAFVLLAVAAALSVGLWLAALNALYRDFRYVLPFLIQIGFVVSPVLFETTALVPEHWQEIYSLNPMVGVIEGFRWALLGKESPPVDSLLISGAATALLLAGGLRYFRRMERTFADWV